MVPQTKYIEREIPKISLRDFSTRIDEITSQLCSAAENTGFFTIIDHDIPPSSIQSIFSASKAFFNLPDAKKASVPWTPQNVGWEKKSQVRPSTGEPDAKESYQLQFGTNMANHWISDAEVPGFKETSLDFMYRVQSVSEKLMLCFARGLGFQDDYFVKYHDCKRPDAQSTLRLLHYYATPKPSSCSSSSGNISHRAGAHVDWGFLTLLFQHPSQPGLEICPGREVVTEHALGDSWTKILPEEGVIVCNIGDLLMSWSDDRFKSTFHRVKAPVEEADFWGERFSIAFFNQPVKEARIQGPGKKYPVVTGEEFTRNAMERNFGALKKTLEARKEGK